MDSKKTYRIVMAVSNDLSNDRRVERHVLALREAGFEVVVVGTKKGVPCKGNVSPVVKDARFVTTRHLRGWRFYAELQMRLYHELCRCEGDVMWANDLDTLPACYRAAKRMGCKLVMDAHELFPEVPEIQGKPIVQWVWRTLERQLMPKCDALLTVCQSIADYYREKYGVEMSVVRNISDCLNVSTPECLSDDAVKNQTFKQSGNQALYVLLYQGCVNKGRGVDWAIDALEWLPDCQLVVAGRGDLLERMKAYASSKPWANRVTFLGHIPPSELPDLTRRADVGLVMLENMGLSYYYALPNRIGDFVAAGVPMVVSDMPEMSAVVRRFGVGAVIDRLHGADGKAQAYALAAAVKKVLAREWSDADFIEARKDMDWNKEKDKLLKLCYTTFC